MKHLIRLILMITLLLESCSFVLKLFVGPVASYGFNYFSVFISLFILLFSFVGLLVLVVRNGFNRETWEDLKQEILMFVCAVGLMILVGVVT